MNIDKSLERYKIIKEVALREAEIKLTLEVCQPDGLKVILNATKIYDFINEDNNPHPLLQSENDKIELSILLALFKENDDSIKYFTHNGVNLESILNTVKLPLNLLEEIDTRPFNKDGVLHFKNYIDYSINEVKEPNPNRNSILQALLSDMNPSQLIETITEIMGSQYKYLLEEINNKKYRELTPEQGYQLLISEEIKDLAPENSADLINYGYEITLHSNYIYKAISDLITTDSVDKSVEGIKELLKEIEKKEKQEEKKKESFLSFVLGLGQDEEDEEENIIDPKNLDLSKIPEIKEKIDEQYDKLDEELKRYQFIKKYMEDYLGKLDEIIKALTKYYEVFKDTPIIEEQSEVKRAIKKKNYNDYLQQIQKKIIAYQQTYQLTWQNYLLICNEITRHNDIKEKLGVNKSYLLNSRFNSFIRKCYH